MKWMTISGLFIILALRFVCWDTLFVCVWGGGLWQCFAGVGFGRVFFLASVLFS